MFSLIPVEVTTLIVEFLSITDAVNFTSSCHFLHDNSPYDPVLLSLLASARNWCPVIPTVAKYSQVLEGMSKKKKQDNMKSLVSFMLCIGMREELSRLFIYNDFLKESVLRLILEALEDLCAGLREHQGRLNPGAVLFITDLRVNYGCEGDQSYECIMKRIVQIAFDLVNDSLPLDEESYYHLLHLHWHTSETVKDDEIHEVVDLEKFINLAIATDHIDAYRELKSRRTQADLEDFLLLGDSYNVTDQDVYSVIRYDSRNIFGSLDVEHTQLVKNLVKMCFEYSEIYYNGSYIPLCGICDNPPTLKESFQRSMREMLSLESHLP